MIRIVMRCPSEGWNCEVPARKTTRRGVGFWPRVRMLNRHRMNALCCEHVLACVPA